MLDKFIQGVAAFFVAASTSVMAAVGVSQPEPSPTPTPIVETIPSPSPSTSPEASVEPSPSPVPTSTPTVVAEEKEIIIPEISEADKQNECDLKVAEVKQKINEMSASNFEAMKRARDNGEDYESPYGNDLDFFNYAKDEIEKVKQEYCN